MAKKKNDFRPELRTGNDFFETASAFQKYLRRCNAKEALHFGQDLFFSGKHGFHKYVWKRLVTVMMEDIGFADLELMPSVVGLYNSYKYLMTLKTKQGQALAWLATSKAITIAAEGKKNRIVDNAKIWAMKSGIRYTMTHDPVGKQDEGLLESFYHACKNQDEKKALIYAHTFCKSYHTDKIINKAIEVAVAFHKPETVNLIMAIKYLYDETLRAKKDYWHAVTFIPMILCRTETDTSSLGQMAKDAMMGKFSTPIPEFAVDFHTKKGKKKGLKYFVKEGSKVNNAVVFKEEDFYWEFAKKYFFDYDDGLVTEYGYQADDEPQKTLFG